MSHSVLRRYTPPTCVLEIIGKSSPLSRWTGQATIKDLRFRLKLDDPRLSEEEQIEIEGDRPQLEALQEAVETYVKEFLAQSSDLLNAERITSTEFSQTKAQPKASSNFSDKSIYIQPTGLLAHELFLGAIAPKEASQNIRLSSLQLFDIATAFDEYAADLVALPPLKENSDEAMFFSSDRNPRSPQFSYSIRMAASLLIALGLTTYTVQKLGEFYAGQESTIATTESENNSRSESIASAPSPVLPSPQTTVAESTQTASNSANASSVESQEIPAPPASLSASRTAKPRVESGSPKSDPSLPPTIIQPSPNLETDPITILPEIANSDANPAIIPPPPPDILEFPEIPPSPIPELEAVAPPTPDLSNDALEELSDLPDRSLSDRPSTAFDKIPSQVTEVKEYFQQRWNPPDSLTKTIEYRLVLNSDGTIKQTIPLGPTAETFLDRTPMPLRGESFVSPLESEFQPTIRLVLEPDGTVQTFLESVN